jgi:shikimate 5-dehydrogenase
VNGTIVARNLQSGQRLADDVDWAFTTEHAPVEGALLVNVTPLGMAGVSTALSFSPAAVATVLAPSPSSSDAQLGCGGVGRGRDAV